MSSIINHFEVIYSPVVEGTIDVSLKIGGEMGGGATSAKAFDVRLKLDGEMSGSVRLALETPPPILNEIEENAFANQYYSIRLLDNLGNEIKPSGATLEAPKGSIGKRVSVNVAKKDLSLITNDKTYTFQVGTRATPTGAITWETIIENGKLNSRNFSLGVNVTDSLSFGTIEPLKNRLNKFPLSNHIFYNPSKTSVELSNSDIIRDTSGLAVPSSLYKINGLTLYGLFRRIGKLLNLTAIETNIPNFELTRADFPITSSWMQSLSSIVGIFEPVIFSVGGTLYLLDKSAAIPVDFNPRPLTVDQFSSWSISIPEAQEIDGYIVAYSADNSQSTYFTLRTIAGTEESGSFGSPDYTRVETETTFKEWRNSDAPDEIIRSEIVSITKETYIEFLTLVSRRSETHNFDQQGKRISSSVINEGLVPDLSNDGVPSFVTVREEDQSVSYTTDSKNTRRSYRSKVVTRVRGMIAVDSENQYFHPDTGEQSDFKQDFLEAHKAGNLKEGMTADYGPLKTITETLFDFGNNQYQKNVSTVDHLRKLETNLPPEPITGDASLPSAQGKQTQTIVLRDGMTLAMRPGNTLESISVGELPLFHAIPLIRRKLARRSAQKQSGSVSVPGYSSSVERGVFFRVYDRDGVSYGKFIAGGFRVSFTPMGDGVSAITEIEVDEI